MVHLDRVRRSRTAMATLLATTVVAVLAATAFACTPQATVFLDGPVEPGGTVSGRGNGFGPANAPGATPVEVHVLTASGTDLGTVWSGASNASGQFSFTFSAPATDGYYLIAAYAGSSRASASNSLQVGDPADAAESSPAPAPAQPEAPAAAATPPSAASAEGAPVPAAVPSAASRTDRVVARNRESAGRTSRSERAARGDSAPSRQVNSSLARRAQRVSVAPGTGPAATAVKSPSSASSGAGEASPNAASRETAPRSPKAAAALTGPSLSSTPAESPGSRLVWFGLALVGAGLLAALMAGAATLGGADGRRWSMARLGHRRHRD